LLSQKQKEVGHTSPADDKREYKPETKEPQQRQNITIVSNRRAKDCGEKEPKKKKKKKGGWGFWGIKLQDPKGA